VATAGPGSSAAAGAASGRIAGSARSGALPVPPGGPDLLDLSGPESRGAGGAAGWTGTDDGEAEADPRGAGAELRHKLRTQRRLRLITMLSLVAVVLLVVPAFFGIRALSNDPVFASLDKLNVPTWAAQKIEDQGYGSRLCLLECRFRDRMAESEKAFPETAKVYTAALSEAGWQPWKVADCPETPVEKNEGDYSCWRRDEMTLDLFVSLPGCAVEQLSAEEAPAAGAGDDPEASSDAAGAAAANCDGSTVSIKVQNTINDQRGKVDVAPGLTGVTPDPVLPTDDPLLNPTPEAS
jgi:hypothetical protein